MAEDHDDPVNEIYSPESSDGGRWCWRQARAAAILVVGAWLVFIGVVGIFVWSLQR